LSFERFDGAETDSGGIIAIGKCLFKGEGDARKMPAHVGEAWSRMINWDMWERAEQSLIAGGCLLCEAW
jgi:hypothetical protein